MIPAVSPEDPSAVPSLVNTIATTVLHSPLHGWLRHHLLLLSFQGRRSGKTYTIPLSYTQEGEMVLCFTRRKGNWWKNLRGSIPVTVDLKGRSWQGIASAVADDQATIEREMYTFLLKSPRDATYQGVQLNPDGTPNRADITRSAQATVLLRIRLQAE
jgi:F420H(2)-dependent quinone reductase